MGNKAERIIQMKKPEFDTATNVIEDADVLEEFKRWYEMERECCSKDLPADEWHALAVAQAVKAVYVLGKSDGYVRGYKEGYDEAVKKQARRYADGNGG